MPLSRPLRLLLPVAILGGAVAVVAYLVSSRPSAPRPQPQERVWQVQTLAVVPETRAAALTLYGLVETPRRSAPAAPGAAVVAQVPVREGDGFAAGALLLELDPRDFLPALAAARAELDESVALLENQRLRGSADREALATEERLLALAEAAVQRAERLLGQKLGSDAELDAARSARARQQLALTERRHAVAAQAATLRQLEARRERAAARLAEAELALERSRVEAPFAGRVAAVHVAAGDRVQTGTPLLDLYPLADLELRARVPARYQAELLAALARDEPLRARTTWQGQALELPLLRLAGRAEPSGLDAFFALPEAAGLRVGALLELQLLRPAVAGAVSVPYAALYGNGRLYLLRDGRLAGVDVEVLGPSAAHDDHVLVRAAALAAGSEVVVTHLPNAVTGLPVRSVP